MKKIAFFDTKSYDRESFDRLNARRTRSAISSRA